MKGIFIPKFLSSFPAYSAMRSIAGRSALHPCSVAAVSGRSAMKGFRRFVVKPFQSLVTSHWSLLFQLLVTCHSCPPNYLAMRRDCWRVLLITFFVLLITCHLSLSSFAAVPQWWITRGVINTNLPVNNYAAVNQGQLKHIAYQAALELEDKLPGGMGYVVEDLVSGFVVKTNSNYFPVNGGQLKNIAKPFYDRLIAEGYTNSYPWTQTTADDANYALVNIGQVKNVFSFDLDKWNPNQPPQVDSDEDGLDDNWETENFGNLTPEPDDDMDGDGIPNSQEQQDGTDPNEPDEDPENPLPPIASYGLIHWQPVNHELSDSDALYATWQVFVNDKGQAIATTAGQGVGVWTTAFAKGSVTAEFEDYMCNNFNNDGKAILESPANEGGEGDGFVYQVWDFESGDFTSAPPINSPPSLLPDDLEMVYSMDVIIDQIICEGSIEEKTSLLGINDPGSLAGTTVFQWRVKYHTYYYDQVTKQWKQSNGEKIINDFRPVYWPQGQIGNAMPVNEDFMETYSYLHTANINNQNAVALMKEGSQFLYYNHASEEPQTLDLPWDMRSRLNNEAQVAGSFYQGKSYATVSKANGPVQALGKGQAIGIAPQGELITGSLFSGQQQQTLLQEPTDKTPAIYQASLRQPTTKRERFPAKQRPALAKNFQNVPLTPQQNTIYEDALLWKKNQDNGKYVRQKVETMLEKTSLAQDWHVQTLHNPNKYGIIGGVGYYKDQPQYLTMIPAELGVDANRDGKIVLLNEKDKEGNIGEEVDQTKPNEFFRFWANDDNDGSPQNEEEFLDSFVKDSDDNLIWSRRDLEDFTRLWVYLKGVHEMVKGEDAMLVGLKWKDTEGSPAIRLFEACEADGDDKYLEDENIATQQTDGQYGTTVQSLNGQLTVNNSDVFIFKPEIWESLDEENYKKYFLFEGVKEGKGKLQIVFLDKDQNEIGEAPPIYLDITNIKKMYQRSEGNQFVQHWDEKDEAIIFVHGWRMSPSGSTSFAETMYKRLWHRGYKGRFAYFRWNTYYSSHFDEIPGGEAIDAYLAKYNDSEHNAWLAGEDLKNFVNTVPKSKKNITAHSMGNIVTGSALRAGMAIDNYVLLQAAVPASCYDESSALKQETPYYQFIFEMWDNPSPDADADPATRALAYRGKLKDVSGNLVNFFLPKDTATFFAWEINNDQTKPPREDALFVKNFQYAPNNPPGQRLYKYHYVVENKIQKEVIDYYLTDPYEAMPYACRAWSKAVGAEGNTEGAIDSAVDMSLEPYKFGTEHSAEFRRSIQKLKDFYKQLADKLKVYQNE
jgi:hypothetical protein